MRLHFVIPAMCRISTTGMKKASCPVLMGRKTNFWVLLGVWSFPRSGVAPSSDFPATSSTMGAVKEKWANSLCSPCWRRIIQDNWTGRRQQYRYFAHEDVVTLRPVIFDRLFLPDVSLPPLAHLFLNYFIGGSKRPLTTAIIRPRACCL